MRISLLIRISLLMCGLGAVHTDGWSTQGIYTPDEELSYTVRFHANDTITLISHTAQDTLIGRIAKRVDLDADGNDELFVFLGGCGNWGHCIYAILTPQTSDVYRQLWAEYLYAYTVTDEGPITTEGPHWKNIILLDRNDYGGNPPALMVHTLLQYHDGKYRESPIAPYPIDSLPTGIHRDFEVQATATVSGKTYQLGRPIAPGWNVVCTSGVCHYIPSNDEHNQYHMTEYPKAPVILRVIDNGLVEDFPLDTYEDLDQYSMQSDSEGLSLLIEARYAVSVFDTNAKRHSPAIIPGRDVDYREDAISGSLASLTFFDGNRYVMGNAQGYGLFCLDFSDISNPGELLRYTHGSENTGQPHLFVGQDHDGLWYGILANSDPQSAVPTIRNQYHKIEQAGFLFQNLLLAKPIEAVDHFLILHVANQGQPTSLVVIDYRAGILLEGDAARETINKLTPIKAPYN